MQRADLVQKIELNKKLISENKRPIEIDLTGQNLAREDLSGLDLSNIIFEKCNLRMANLSDCDLSNTDFSLANLEQVNLDGATLKNACFYGANLTYAHMENVDAEGANFRHARLKNTSLIKGDFKNASFLDVNLNNAYFRGTNLDGADLRWASTQEVLGQEIIAIQVNTERDNRTLSYWADLDVWTYGLFLGNLEKWLAYIDSEFKGDEKVIKKLTRATSFILLETEED